ncbi:MAG: helix-turn-helix transcriptional regulator [Clostridia bacterium]|nr:helix-turn-helix transcriptional regulator [Clostridia bacterium]
MKQTGQGVLQGSEIFFSSPSVRAKNLFYHVLCAGHFFCDSVYSVDREHYDSYLVLHVIKGSLSFLNKDGVEACAREGETVIIDCYKPHSYCTHDKLESVWVHIDGSDTKKLCDDIINTRGNIIRKRNNNNIRESLFKLFNVLGGEKRFFEPEMSLEVYRLILELWNEQDAQGVDKETSRDGIQKVIDYVALHLNEEITVKTMAAIAHMSVTHFSRVFKQKSGFSPYEYVLNARLNTAKELLLKTDMSVTDVAYETGFNSEANFVYCFTKNEGISPGRFRKSWF